LGLDVETLAEYKQQGYKLESYKHIPEDIRQKLYDIEKESLEVYKKTTTSVANLPIPITITVLPVPAKTPAPNMPSKSILIDCLNIPGQLEEYVAEYSTWHESRVKTEGWKADCKKACNVIIKHGVDLNQICCNRDPQFLIDEGILKRTAKQFVSNIDY
jgi:hypothetical protein